MKYIRSNHARISRLFFMAVTAFVLVFCLRLSYELVFTNHDIVVTVPTPVGMGFDSHMYGRVRLSNIATDKVSQVDMAGNIVVIDQKYEKTANISSVSHRFDEDHERLRLLIATHDAMVQTENLHGLPGNQVLTMTIGVSPQHFDYMVNSLRELGILRSFTVNRVDKTNEFNNLLAQQEVLRMTRDSYAALQELGGNIQDRLLLLERILGVETSLQLLGVDLGLFAAEHSFCTINFTLREQEPALLSLRFVLNRAMASFWWTLGAAVIAALVTLGLLGVVAFGLWLRVQIAKHAQAQVPEPATAQPDGVELPGPLEE